MTGFPRQKGTRSIRPRSAERQRLHPGDRLTNGKPDRELEVVLPGAGRFVLVTDGDREFWLPREGLVLVARAARKRRTAP